MQTQLAITDNTVRVNRDTHGFLLKHAYDWAFDKHHHRRARDRFGHEGALMYAFWYVSKYAERGIMHAPNHTIAYKAYCEEGNSTVAD